MADILTKHLYIGLMSGTSLDGVDAVLLDTRTMHAVDHVHLPFSPAFAQDLASLCLYDVTAGSEIERAGSASVALSQLYADAVHVLLKQSQIKAYDIAAIGAHGQTIRHRPALGFTVQIQQPALLAERTGISVVADFRARDIAAGGQGAPLVPAFHAAVFQHPTKTRAIVNIGGIANVSVLPSKASGQAVRGWDIGPGNTLLDAWTLEYLGKPFDENGAWAATGDINLPLLQALLTDAYFQKAAPKSTGREYFHLHWLKPFLQNQKPQDVAATLTALTVQSILNDTKGVDEIFVCGGGALNATLMRQLKAKTTAELGVPVMQVEAMAFAWLAYRCMHALAGNLPAVTGARGERILGAIYPV